MDGIGCLRANETNGMGAHIVCHEMHMDAIDIDNEPIIFIPYGSRLGFHVGGPASTMANIDYKFPQCVCYNIETNEKQND